MRVQRLRPAHTFEGLTNLYPRPHDIGDNRSHAARVTMTIAFGRFMEFHNLIADLSCGDGLIARALATHVDPILGDFAPGYPIQGPIEETIQQIAYERVNGFVLSETLEHIDMPASLLSQIRNKADRLLLTTPIGCWDDANPEHYWAWDREYVERLAGAVGWKVDGFCSVDSTPLGGWYTFGIWVMS